MRDWENFATAAVFMRELVKDKLIKAGYTDTEASHILYLLTEDPSEPRLQIRVL